jgi:hypothetical protein
MMNRISGQRWMVPLRNKLAIALVVSKKNSSMGLGYFPESGVAC